MSVRQVLPSVFALILALGVSAGAAQAAEGDMAPGATTPKMGAPGAAPEMGTPGARPNAMDERPDQSSAAPQGGPGKSAEEKGSEGNLPQQGKSAQEAMPSEGKMTEQPKANEGAAEPEGKPGKMTKGQPGATTEGKTGATTEGKTGTTAEGKAETQGSTGKSVKLESKEVSKVKSYFAEHKPSVQRIEKSRVSVSIGVALPTIVVLYDLPPDIIVVHGACPIKYFVWGDDIVLVDSCTRQVVEIIPGVA
jgi:Protein of unknown function (DUF1236)